MTRQEFIIETLKPYFLDTTKCAIIRIGSGSFCMYRTEDGRKCAFGQHIRDEVYHESMETNEASNVITEFGVNILSDEAVNQNLTGEQWNTIQRIHDKVSGDSTYEYPPLNTFLEKCEQYCMVDLTELKNINITK